MKRIITILIFSVTLFNKVITAQVVNPPYELAIWKGFAKAAVSYTWDDNTPKQLSDALPLYDKYGFKITFFPIVSLNPDWNGLKQAGSNGHEIGSHTMTHTALNTLSDEDQEKEQKNSQAEINTQLGNNKCLILAYPYCTVGNKSITDKYYISARGCSGQVENKTPGDFLNVSSIICGAQGAIHTAADFNSTVNNAIAKNGWTVFLLHGINNDGGYSPVDSIELSQHLAYMSSNTDKFWVNTYGNVVRYIRERDAASVQEVSNTDSLITFSVTHNLDAGIYNFPLTVKRSVPDTWTTFTVSQNGTTLPVKTVNENGKLYLVTDVIPNAGNVLIRNTKVTGITDNSSVSHFLVYPNPFHAVTKVQFVVEKPSEISIVLLDVSGKKICTMATGVYSAGSHELSMDTSGLNGTVFYCVLYMNGKIYEKKLISF